MDHRCGKWLDVVLFTLIGLAWVGPGAGCGGSSGLSSPEDAAASCDGAKCGGCTADFQCGAGHPRCDKNTGTCVPCLPQNDNCPFGKKCVAQNDSYVCSMSCASAADCPKSDAGGTADCCSGVCIDTASDRANCGSCGKACAAVPNGVSACQSGACAIGSCTAGFADCNQMIGDGCETATATDPKSCGSCNKVCPPVKNGAAGCQAGACAPQCNTGFLHCSMSDADGCEVQSATDPNNCGGCGKLCAGLAHAQSTCANSSCNITGCDQGFSDCNKLYTDGCEASTATDLANCGGCGTVCNTPNATPACKAGRCSVDTCNMGFADCDGLGTNGCETAVSSDVKNCGACSRVCSAANGTPGCTKGICNIAACNQGYADCDGNLANGCEAAVSMDLGNCGGCGKVCALPANATPSCTNGTCGIGMCKFGYADCNKDPKDGCEANLLSPMTCGSCNTSCMALPHASAGCNAGMCGIAMCDALFGDCDGMAANGCERSLAMDVANCGGCGRVCVTPNAAPVCMSGMCAIGQCAMGYSDCNMLAGDGCEANINTDPKSCGKCGVMCPGGANAVPACSMAACGLACNQGYADCDKMAANGCEINVKTDVANCGGCNTACPVVANGTPGCSAGVCGIGTCNMGYADCDAMANNGCEKNTLVDVNNCGKCGAVCAYANANPGCLNGQCGILSCKAGFADCDKVLANGCEVSTTGDAMNCGACGKICGAQTPTCTNGVCVAKACKGVAGGVISAAMGGATLYGSCWYLGTNGSTCDAVCALAGGSNQAVAASTAFVDDCVGGAVGQPATFFFQNGNKGNWTGPQGQSTGYKTLGHGYNASTYYGKCTTVNLAINSGSFPGEPNDNPARAVVCACSQ